MQLKVAQQGNREKADRVRPCSQRLSTIQKPGLPGMAGSLLHLQRKYGNHYVQGLLSGTMVQCKCACGGTCEHCHSEKVQEQGMIQRILQRKGNGQMLETGVRSFMETRFTQDFSGVRIHTDAHAAETARQLNAAAYTVGRDIFFGSGQYRPQTLAGRRLLAHELAHVVQQSGIGQGASLKSLHPLSDFLEVEADRVANRVIGLS